MPSDATLSFLDKKRRDIANKIIQGLTTALLIRSDSPCVNILAVLLCKFYAINSFIAERGSETPISTIRSNYGDLLDAYAMFANSIWTVEEIETFESCKCRHHSGELESHLAEMDALDEHVSEYLGEDFSRLQYIITEIFEKLAIASIDMMQTKSDAFKLERRAGKRSRWPSSPSQYIPHGAPIAVSAFMRWAKLGDTLTPIHVLCHAASWCPSLAPAMSQNEELLPLIQQLLHQFATRLRQLTPTSISGSRYDTINNNIRCLGTILDGSHHWFQDLRSKLARTHSAPRRKDIVKSLIGMYDDIHAIISHLENPRVFELVDNRRAERWIKALAVNAMVIRDVLPQPIADFLPINQSMRDILQLGGEGIEEMVMLHTNLIYGALFARSQRKCAETLCLETGEEKQVNFKLCAGCQAVRYCSKGCQRSDWKHHKPACKLLKVVAPAAMRYSELPPDLDVNEKLRTFSDALEQAGVGTDSAFVALKYLNRIRVRQQEIKDNHSLE